MSLFSILYNDLMKVMGFMCLASGFEISKFWVSTSTPEHDGAQISVSMSTREHIGARIFVSMSTREHGMLKFQWAWARVSTWVLKISWAWARVSMLIELTHVLMSSSCSLAHELLMLTCLWAANAHVLTRVIFIEKNEKPGNIFIELIPISDYVIN